MGAVEVTMYVTYAGDAGTPFDRRHWIDVHLPLVRECWGPHGLEQIGGFFPDGDGAGLIAVCACVFRDKAAMRAALASPETARVMDDVSKSPRLNRNGLLPDPCETMPFS